MRTTTQDSVAVDTNVTANAERELGITPGHKASSDWSAMILHYLGLDHIGHQFGGKHSQIPFKLKEMDNVIRSVHAAVAQQDRQRCADSNGQDCLPTLLLVCSDHGMTEDGSHGGPSDSETAATAIFISEHFSDRPPRAHHSFMLATSQRLEHRDSFRPIGAALLKSPFYARQIDIASSLALLLGIPIPINNIGHLMTPLFAYHSHRDLLKCVFSLSLSLYLSLSLRKWTAS